MLAGGGFLGLLPTDKDEDFIDEKSNEIQNSINSEICWTLCVSPECQRALLSPETFIQQLNSCF